MTDYTELMKQNLYKILGCAPDSSHEQLKNAYHRRILASHPDKSSISSNTNSALFQQVKSAWEILGNPARRKEYDARYRQTELEAQSDIIYARVVPSDLEATEDSDIFSYPCRCGNSYLVHRTDLEDVDTIMHIPCEDCTFVIALET